MHRGRVPEDGHLVRELELLFVEVGPSTELAAVEVGPPTELVVVEVGPPTELVVVVRLRAGMEMIGCPKSTQAWYSHCPQCVR